MEFKTLLERDFILLDGAMGTMLQQKGMQPGSIPELLNLQKPQWIEEIHTSYLQSGAHVVYANTFGANRYKLEGTGYSVKEVIEAGVSIAKRAAQKFQGLAALDLGPIGQLLEPTGSLSFDEAYDIFREQVVAGRDAGADLIVIETITDLSEARAAVLAAKENSHLPVLCTMTFERNLRTFTGCCPSSMALCLQGLGVDALGINCSLGPDEIVPLVEELFQWTTLPIIAKPNAGLPDPGSSHYDISPDQFAASMAKLGEMGVKILGGCCGTTPQYIRQIKECLASVQPHRPMARIPAAVCSASRTVPIDRARIIGERINPTGKKLFKEALRRQDVDYILTQALQQVGAGADILDVNVGLPDIDERQMMVRAVKALQGVVDAPLQIDSTKADVLEAALRVYNGKAIVNSVNGEEKSLDTILPLVKKYGAAVVGLTLDENGIPKTARQRLNIAKKILDRALSLGIRREDVYIDCLTLTASAEQAAVQETLQALRLVKQELGLKTVLGVSNISFGLPNRGLVNSTFLAMALMSGLDLPILNPNVEAMTGAVRAYHVLMNVDKDSKEFIEAYGSMEASKPAAPAASTMDLIYAVKNGLKTEAASVTQDMLRETDAMDVVNGYLIPALDETGADFEKGTIFLPQLIQSAGAAQAAFEVIKNHLASSGGTSVDKGTIVLATVKGDIHDIGKNIVKVLLENYGYTVIDLGRDVECQAVVDAAIQYQAPLVGLSALMTTTLQSMEDTIALLHSQNVPCKIMVGGAVLTPDYAQKIGADFYAKDAKQSVDIAKTVLG